MIGLHPGKMQWQEDYHSGKIIIADRYVMSNLIHQASKFAEHKEKEQFQNWLENLEYQIFGLPKLIRCCFCMWILKKRLS